MAEPRIPPPPIGVLPFDKAGNFVLPWQLWFLKAASAIADGSAPADAQFLIATANAILTDAQNLGLLASGYLKIAVALGVATPSSVATIPVGDISGGHALTKVDDTNVTLTLGGTPANALLAAVSLTLGWTGVLSAARGGTGVGTTGDITRVDDTNVTLTLGGTPVGAVINGVSFTVGWTGTLAVSRGGIGVGTLAVNGVLYGAGTSAVLALAVNATATNKYLRQVSSGAPSWETIPASEITSPGALTKVDDTNVTVTLGGAPATALLAAASLTLGWTGTLAVARGGIGVGTLTLHGVLYGNGTSAVQAGAALTSGKMPIATTDGVLIDLTPSAAYTPTNVTTDRSYDANATTIDELADVLGTVIADLQAKGILG